MAHGIFYVEPCGIFCCGVQAICCDVWCVGFLFPSCGAQAPGHMGSVVVACGFQRAWALQFAVQRLSS